MKKIIVVLLTLTFVFCFSIIAFAGTGKWKQDANGIWYQKDDGTYPQNEWIWIDDNGDGIAESYYFDGNGYLVVNTTTPDNYTVNEKGQWVVNNVVQTKQVSNGSGLNASLFKSSNPIVGVWKTNLLGVTNYLAFANNGYMSDSYSTQDLFKKNTTSRYTVNGNTVYLIYTSISIPYYQYKVVGNTLYLFIDGASVTYQRVQ